MKIFIQENKKNVSYDAALRIIKLNQEHINTGGYAQGATHGGA